MCDVTRFHGFCWKQITLFGKFSALQVQKLDGTEVWRRRHYRVRRAEVISQSGIIDAGNLAAQSHHVNMRRQQADEVASQMHVSIDDNVSSRVCMCCMEAFPLITAAAWHCTCCRFQEPSTSPFWTTESPAERCMQIILPV